MEQGASYLIDLRILWFDKKIYCGKTYFSGAVTVSLQGAFTADEQEEGLDGHDCVGGHVHAVDDVHVLDTTGSDQSFQLELKKKWKFVKWLLTLAKTEIIHPKNVRVKVAINFT